MDHPVRERVTRGEGGGCRKRGEQKKRERKDQEEKGNIGVFTEDRVTVPIFFFFFFISPIFPTPCRYPQPLLILSPSSFSSHRSQALLSSQDFQGFCPRPETEGETIR